MAAGGPVVVNPPSRTVFDLASATLEQLEAWSAGYHAGLATGSAIGRGQGWTEGYEACDDELAALQRVAHRNVQAMARLDPYPVREAARRRHQVEAGARAESQLAHLRRSLPPGEVA